MWNLHCKIKHSLLKTRYIRTFFDSHMIKLNLYNNEVEMRLECEHQEGPTPKWIFSQSFVHFRYFFLLAQHFFLGSEVSLIFILASNLLWWLVSQGSPGSADHLCHGQLIPPQKCGKFGAGKNYFIPGAGSQKDVGWERIWIWSGFCLYGIISFLSLVLF